MNSLERIYPLSPNQIEVPLPSRASGLKNIISDHICQIESKRLSEIWAYDKRVVDSIVIETEKRQGSTERRYTGMVTITPRPDESYIARILEWRDYIDGVKGYSFVIEIPLTDKPTKFSLQSFRDSVAITTLHGGSLQIIKERESPSIFGILTEGGSYFSRPGQRIQFDGYTIP